MKKLYVIFVLSIIFGGQDVFAQVILRVFTKDKQKYTFEKSEVTNMQLMNGGTGKNDIVITSAEFNNNHADFSCKMYVDDEKFMNYSHGNYTRAGVACSNTTPYAVRDKTSYTSGIDKGEFKIQVKRLKYDREYYFRPWFEKDLRTYYGEAVRFRTAKPQCPEMLDLGLSVKWAANSIGADQDDNMNSGAGFFWGDIECKFSDEFSWANYCWYDAVNSNITKYNTDPSLGVVDGKTILDSSDDVANYYFGGTMRLPTEAEVEELFAKCKVVSSDFFVTVLEAPNGTCINLTGAFWVNSLSSSDCTKAKVANPLYKAVMEYDRNMGMNVLPVCNY